MCTCGHHRSLTNHPDAQFAIEVETCDVCATVAKFQRIQAAEDEKQTKAPGAKPDPAADWPDDGRRIAVRLVEMPDLTDDNN